MRIHFKNDKLNFIVGDIRDFENINSAMVGVDYLFHAGALKQVPSCEFYPLQAIKTNILGAENVLEAAVYNKPVIIGPEYEKYFEAVELVEKEGAFSIENALELEELFNELFEDNDLYDYCAAAAGNYVRSKAGATNGVMQYIQEKRLLTN